MTLSRLSRCPRIERQLTDRATAVQNSRNPRNPQDSPYPWSSRRLNFTTTANPFPRYGAAINSVASKDGVIYLMGGLVSGSTVKGDLWVTEMGNGSMACYPISTTGDGPGPRVGHASLLVGNAFIVFGGDTKLDDNDDLDDTLYLLNTCMFGSIYCIIRMLITHSYETLVASTSPGTTTNGPLRAHSEYSGFQDLHLRRTGGGFLFQ